MGISIALTGVVLFLFGIIMGSIANSPPKQIGLVRFFGLIMLVGIFIMPIGLIIQIWQ